MSINIPISFDVNTSDPAVPLGLTVRFDGAEVFNSLCNIGPPTLLSVAEIYKVRTYIKMYMENLKLVMKKTTSN